ncbi:MAG: substrate-binding domain-containing protein [Candidatus Latescibacterota bacterium]
MKRTDFLKYGIGGASLLSLACSGKKGTDSAKTPSQGKREDLYFEISALGSASYFYDHKEGLRLAGEHFGVRTEYKGPPDLNIQAMIQALELAVARKPGGIMVVGFEESLNDSVNKAVEAGIPVVTLDSDLPNSRRVAFVGTGNYDAGFRGGMKLAELVGGKGKVAVMTKVGQPNLEERVRGYRDALAKHPGIELARVADTKSEVPMAAQAAAAVLAAVPGLAGIGCVEAAGGAGSATAVKEANQAGKVRIVAMDRDNDILTYIRDGIIDATVVQQTMLMPWYGLAILHQMNHFDIPISNDNLAAGVSAVPRVIDTGTILVDKSCCQAFMR